MEKLTKKQLLNLLNAYDSYIQEANESNKYQEGWFPVCIEEFLNQEDILEYIYD